MRETKPFRLDVLFSSHSCIHGWFSVEKKVPLHLRLCVINPTIRQRLDVPERVFLARFPCGVKLHCIGSAVFLDQNGPIDRVR